MPKTQHHYRYIDARAAFLSRVGAAKHTAHVHPMAGPDGEIAMDVVFWEGRKNPDNVLVLSSGTHGIEGYCGSYVQCALLDDGLAEQVIEQGSLMMIHGVNPHGFAWQRRVNENNVDLNRNFIDHSQPHPENTGYQELAALLEPASWNANTAKQIAGELVARARQRTDNPRWLQSAWSGGQYEFPMGQFYGGLEPQWSNHLIRELAATRLKDQKITWIDIHTALGEFATAQLIVEMDAGSRNLKIAQELWGRRVGNIRANDSVAIPIAGSILTGVEATLGRSILGASLEYGTVESMEVGGALVQDQYLTRFGDLDSELGVQTKDRMMNAFYPDDQGWRASVLEIAQETVAAVLKGFVQGQR